MTSINGHQNGVHQNGQQNLEKEESMRLVKQSQMKGMNFDATMKCYVDWTPTYDKVVSNLEYTGPKLVSEYFCKYAEKSGITKDSLIIDVGAGTGLVAEVLAKPGYTNIDAVDASEPMLKAADEKGIYKRLYCAMLGEGRKLPMIDNTYDAAVMSGIFVQGHVKLDALLDIIRLVKPGGLIVNAMRENNIHEVEEYKNIHELFGKWEKEGLWECIEQLVPSVKFYGDYKGLVHVYKVCAKK